ncbi:hypothetical protein A3H26_03655 [candidate division WWE3 bacterium RIFCSPLOWO2_12_FULL_36_10]|uniref:NIF system FeS cluster assembly NifU N-terminal domain-containing protein n=1 Tax=candidate division WWE3 bacterium RIFCSPLOWO2_12_FULL_36_10 TaxID=1802630 RepID=A0A1F4VGA1_UNCKA|nr:MAG: hypothetical protein A3H26_03655 [candidate division WWE3 bacterium RIFCSPLOWO2_12_FULL_36_10]
MNMYREELMEHYKNPLHRGVIKNPTREVEKKNPMCGDIIRLQVIVKGNVVEDVKYNGESCAICLASADILAHEVIGKSVFEVKKMSKKDLLELIGVELTTSRVKCAELSLIALMEALK